MQAGGQNNATNYSSGGVYKNGTLSFISTGQGRTDMTKSPPRQEYFVKDHLGNIRSTVASATTGGVTPGPQSLAYTAGYEPADEAVETALFDKVSELSAAKPGSLSAADQKAALLQDSQRLGTSIMLKVMAGDKLEVNADNFYESLQNSNSNNEAAGGQLFEQVIGSLAGGSGALSSAEGSSPNVLTERILSNPEAVIAYEDLLAAETDSTRPEAFLNYLFFDEELNLVPEHSRIWQADGESSWSKIGSAEYVPLEVPQNGYIVAYLSNQSGQEAWFDNMSLVVSPGILLEERHYYAYGLPIAGLGSQAATALSNRQRYQGNEYIEELGLEWMDFHNRQYDPQLGRFLSVDPLADAGGQQVLSPYHAMACNPVSMVDPLGLKAGLAPDARIPNYGAPNAGVAYIEGQMVVLGGTKTFNFEGDYASHQAWHAKWVKEQIGKYEKASQAESAVQQQNESLNGKGVDYTYDERSVSAGESNNLDYNRIVIKNRKGKITSSFNLGNNSIKLEGTGNPKDGQYFEFYNNPDLAYAVWFWIAEKSNNEWSLTEFKLTDGIVYNRISTSYMEYSEGMAAYAAEIYEFATRDMVASVIYWAAIHSHPGGNGFTGLSDEKTVRSGMSDVKALERLQKIYSGALMQAYKPSDYSKVPEYFRGIRK